MAVRYIFHSRYNHLLTRIIDFLIDSNGMSACQGIFIVHCTFIFTFFWVVVFLRVSWLLLYDIKYFYRIQIICTQPFDFKYSYLILLLYTLLRRPPWIDIILNLNRCKNNQNSRKAEWTCIMTRFGLIYLLSNILTTCVLFNAEISLISKLAQLAGAAKYAFPSQQRGKNPQRKSCIWH